MKSFTLFIAAIFVFCSHFAISQTADEIVEKSLKNYGGLEKMKEIKTWSITGSQFAPQMQANLPFKAFYKEPDKFRLEMEAMGQTIVQVAVGETGWMKGPMGVMDVPKEQLSQITMIKDFFGNPLSDYKENVKSAELIGKVQLNGKDVYNVKMTAKEGQTFNMYFDAISFFIEKTSINVGDSANPQILDIIFKNRAKINGVVYSKLVELYSGSELATKIEYEKVEANIPVEDSIFIKPKN